MKSEVGAAPSSHHEMDFARQALQQWKASKVQLIAAVEQQAKRYAAFNVDVEEVIGSMGACGPAIPALRGQRSPWLVHAN